MAREMERAEIERVGEGDTERQWDSGTVGQTGS